MNKIKETNSSNLSPALREARGLKLNFAGKIAKFFLENRPLTILILVGLIFAGFLSYKMTPKQYNPTISMPAFTVIVDYPGASAEEVERFVTRELEEKIADVPGVDKIFSQSMDGGRAVSFVQFLVGEDFEDSRVKLTNKVLGNLDLRQGMIQTPLIKSVSADDVPVLTIGFSAKNLSQNQVRVLAYDIMNQLKKVPNVANLDIHGGEPRVLKISLDLGRMKNRGVSVQDIKNAILANNFRFRTGKIENPANFFEVEVNGELTDPESAKKITVVPGVKLEDVAKVSDGYREKTSFVQVFKKDGVQDTVFVSLAKRKGSNAQTVVKDAREALSRIMANEKFAGLDFHIYRDEGEVSRKAIGGLMQNLISSILIVSIVLWLFLGLRSASIVAIAIPLTMAGVFIIGYSAGKNINRVTLFALILSLGLLVDSATVVVENIYRHLQEKAKSAKKSLQVRREAIVEAVNEVGIGLFLSTLTSVIVFLPTSNLSGMMGDYMGPLSFFLPMALIVSMLVAYVLTPFLADVILPRDLTPNPLLEGEGAKRNLSFFDRVTEKYSKLLTKILDKDKFRRFFLITIFGALFLVFTFPVLKLVHFKMLPSANKNQFFVYIDAPQDTNFPQTQKIAGFISKELLKNPEIVSVQSFVGTASVVDFNGLFKGANYRIAPYMATLRVNLTDTDDRSIKSTPLLDAERDKILAKISKLQNSTVCQGEACENPVKNSPHPNPLPEGEGDINFYETLKNTTFKFLEDPPGPPVRATLMAKIKGPNRELLKKVARDVEEMFRKTDRVVDIDTSISDNVRKVSFRVDHEKALEAGITTMQIYEALSAITAEKNISQFHQKDSPEMIDITLSVPPEKRDKLEDLTEVYIKNFAGNMVPLSAVVRKVETRPEEVLYLDTRDETIYVTGELKNRSVIYATIDLMFDIFDYDFPEGGKIVDWSLYGFDFETKSREIYHIEWGGERELTLDNFRDLGLAMLIAFIAIYGVLVAQFESFKVPLLIMSTVFLGFLGIMPGFAILDKTLGTFLTATSLIGFIALMGIVVNNAIIYLEYFDILRDRGVNFRDALFQAGKTRLRPIVLTSMTTVLGSLTIINDPVWSGLAWTIIFGLSISAAFTLVVFPALMASFPPKVRDEDHLLKPNPKANCACEIKNPAK